MGPPAKLPQEFWRSTLGHSLAESFVDRLGQIVPDRAFAGLYFRGCRHAGGNLDLFPTDMWLHSFRINVDMHPVINDRAVRTVFRQSIGADVSYLPLSGSINGRIIGIELYAGGLTDTNICDILGTILITSSLGRSTPPTVVRRMFLTMPFTGA
jgi:hypothetical protein